MKKFLLCSFLIAMAVKAGLPPTATKGQGDASYKTTFNFDFDTIPLIHTGTSAKVGTIPYSKLNLSNSIVNSDVNSSAGIVYSKLNLSNSIVNADINSAAAIAYSKLLALTTNRALQSDGSGFVSASSVTSTELGYLSGVTSAIQTQLNGKVDGPASATDTAIAIYNGTTGKLVKNSVTAVDSSGVITANDYKFNDTNFNTVSSKELVAGIGGTGVASGGVVSIGTPNTTASISDGFGYVTVNTGGTASLKRVSWTGLTNFALTFRTTNLVTYLAIDNTGAVVQQVTPFTDIQARDNIIIGAAVHTNLSTVNAVNQLQHVILSPINQLQDLQNSLGFFNVSGNIYSANGANLNINKSAGVIHKTGSNWDVNAKDPNVRSLSSGTAITFRYRVQTGSEGSDVTSIDPNNYDISGTITAVPNNKYTIQRISVFSSNLTRIQYGQNLYNNLADAIAAIQTETFVTEANISQNGLLRGFLVLKQGTTDLTNASNAFFLEAPKFGGASGVGGLSTTTMQGAYNNSSTPQITTTTALGSVDLKRGSAADTDYVMRILNGAGSLTAGFTGNGNLTASGVASTGVTGTGKVVFDTAPTISGHPTIEGVTSTGATGTGKFVFDTSPTLATPNIGVANGTSLVLGGTINANAIADFQSTTKAFMAPRMTTTQRDAIASPAAGMEIYNTTTNTMNVYNGTTWMGAALSADYPRRTYTATYTGFGTTTNNECYESREGEYNVIDCKFTTGTPTATEARVSLPGSNVAQTFTQGIRMAQGMWCQNSVASSIVKCAPILIESGAAYITFGNDMTYANAVSPLAKMNGNVVAGSQIVHLWARVPINGWTSNTGNFTGIPQVPGGAGIVDTFSVTFGTTNATTACSATPCSYLDQIGTAVSSVSRSGTGAYSLNTVATYTKLKCTLNFGGTSGSNDIHLDQAKHLDCSSCNTLSFGANSDAGAIDAAGTLYCQGSR